MPIAQRLFHDEAPDAAGRADHQHGHLLAHVRSVSFSGLTVVGSPFYLARHGVPRHPRELTDHVCINWEPSAGGAAYRWEFTENGKDFSVSIDARVVTTDPDLNIRLAVAGVGLAMAFDRPVRDRIEAGELVPVLEEYCEPFSGFHLYFPRRRNRPAALRALIDYVRREIRR